MRTLRDIVKDLEQAYAASMYHLNPECDFVYSGPSIESLKEEAKKLIGFSALHELDECPVSHILDYLLGVRNKHILYAEGFTYYSLIEHLSGELDLDLDVLYKLIEQADRKAVDEVDENYIPRKDEDEL
jgi:hypothetical protein